MPRSHDSGIEIVDPEVICNKHIRRTHSKRNWLRLIVHSKSRDLANAHRTGTEPSDKPNTRYFFWNIEDDYIYQLLTLHLSKSFYIGYIVRTYKCRKSKFKSSHSKFLTAVKKGIYWMKEKKYSFIDCSIDWLTAATVNSIALNPPIWTLAIFWLILYTAWILKYYVTKLHFLNTHSFIIKILFYGQIDFIG